MSLAVGSNPVNLSAAAQRVARPRTYLMCRPTYFDVTYEINAWMHADVEVDRELAMRQWEDLRSTYLDLGNTVEVIEGVPGQPDMVFAANAGTVVGGRVVAAKFLRPERTGEEAPYRAWFAARYPEMVIPEYVNEGEGDYLWTGSALLAGSGFRTDPKEHTETAASLGVPLVPLELVSPSFYHLDTALAVLADDQIAYLPEAFSHASQQVLRDRFPDAIIATRADADWFGLNATSDGRNVVVAAQAEQLQRDLTAAGYRPVPVDVSEFRKAGGGIKCCTLELRG
ncbi:dimethylargininase [Nakamurella lactea]|uniref:dimethylargininase n=1 Tax=Nakamurella lactea TaxID=459515 RepID=UPI0004270ADC|nr:dimethylargininase [Nakamurella lactea]